MPVITLAYVESNCEMDGECWMWKNGTTNGGQPQARDSVLGVLLVRRRVFELASGAAIGTGRWFVAADCGRKRCVSPTCAKKLNSSDYMLWLTRTGAINGPAHNAAKVAALRSRARTKLSPEAAQSIRQRIADGEDRGEVAAHYGISRGHLNVVARGDCWGRYSVATSIFTMRR